MGRQLCGQQADEFFRFPPAPAGLLKIVKQHQIPVVVPERNDLRYALQLPFDPAIDVGGRGLPDTEQGHEHPRLVQVKPQQIGSFLELLNTDLVIHPPVHHIIPQDTGAVFIEGLMGPGQVQLVPNRGQGSREFLQINRLQQVVLDAQRHAFFQIGEFVIPAEHDDFQIRLEFTRRANQIQTGHLRHRNIGNENVGRLLAERLQRVAAVLGVSYDLHPQPGPIDDIV
ncbi:hypothetical protein D1872_253000 [compost metagenome]